MNVVNDSLVGRTNYTTKQILNEFIICHSNTRGRLKFIDSGNKNTSDSGNKIVCAQSRTALSADDFYRNPNI